MQWNNRRGNVLGPQKQRQHCRMFPHVPTQRRLHWVQGALLELYWDLLGAGRSLSLAIGAGMWKIHGRMRMRGR
eukprot:2495264-Pyramimonas_sp.AAC.1